MSKTYRRTKSGQKIDWLPTNSYIYAFDDIKETKEELLEFIETHPVWPEEKTSFFKGYPSLGVPDRIIKWTKWHNLYEVREAQRKLEAIEWVEKHPHRKHDFKDWFCPWGYAKNPSWWNHDYCIVPGRARTKEKLRAIKKGELDPDDICWDDYKKPCPYYW